jgi:homoserine O-acetyltransferase
MARITGSLDANDVLYAVDSSRNYDPSSKLETIQAHVMFINPADDFINLPSSPNAKSSV